MSAELKELRSDGMSAAQIGKALGVHRVTVVNWFRAGYIKAMDVPHGARKIFIADVEVVYEALYTCLALFPCLNPDTDWIDAVADARDNLYSEYVTINNIANSLALSLEQMHSISARESFPRYAFNPHHGHAWYRREDVRKWLALNPRYQEYKWREI